MNSIRTFVVILLVAAAFGAAGAYWLLPRGTKKAPKPAPPSSLAGPQVEKLMKEKKYDEAVPLLQAKFAEYGGNASAQAQIKFLLGICAQNIERAAATRAAAAATQAAADAASRPADAAVDSSIDPTTLKPRVPHEKIKPGDVPTMTITQMANFDYDAEKGGTVPADVLALNGATIRLQGYMLPLTQAQYLTEFALVPTLFNCCFGAPPGVQHVVSVHVPAGKKVEYTMYEVVVEGNLRVEVRRKDNYTENVFDLDAKSVKIKPTPKVAE